MKHAPALIRVPQDSEAWFALERLLLAVTAEACPYYKAGGVCVTGCWEEPRCITDCPSGDGWLAEAVEAADELAAELRYDAREARGDHGLVKNLRDEARYASKLARRLEGGRL